MSGLLRWGRRKRGSSGTPPEDRAARIVRRTSRRPLPPRRRRDRRDGQPPGQRVQGPLDLRQFGGGRRREVGLVHQRTAQGPGHRRRSAVGHQEAADLRFRAPGGTPRSAPPGPPAASRRTQPVGLPGRSIAQTAADRVGIQAPQHPVEVVGGPQRPPRLDAAQRRAPPGAPGALRRARSPERSAATSASARTAGSPSPRRPRPQSGEPARPPPPPGRHRLRIPAPAPAGRSRRRTRCRTPPGDGRSSPAWRTARPGPPAGLPAQSGPGRRRRRWPPPSRWAGRPPAARR